MPKVISLPVQAAFITKDAKHVMVFNPQNNNYDVLEQDPDPGPNNPRWKAYPVKKGSFAECVAFLEEV
jgi:hypothetical protein